MKEQVQRAEKIISKSECTLPGEAHTKSQMVKAELELEINKLRAEEAALRDSLHKMQALNEGLGQDKIELNKIIMQVSK